MVQWTREELDALAFADAEIEKYFCITRAEIAASREIDDIAVESRMDKKTAARKRYNREYNRRYYWENKSAKHDAYAKYYAKNRERIIEKNERYQRENAEYEAEYKRAYYRENRERCLAKVMLRDEVNRAYQKIISELEAESE